MYSSVFHPVFAAIVLVFAVVVVLFSAIVLVLAVVVVLFAVIDVVFTAIVVLGIIFLFSIVFIPYGALCLYDVARCCFVESQLVSCNSALFPVEQK